MSTDIYASEFEAMKNLEKRIFLRRFIQHYIDVIASDYIGTYRKGLFGGFAGRNFLKFTRCDFFSHQKHMCL